MRHVGGVVPPRANTTSQGLRQSKRFVSNLIREIKDLVSIDFSVNAGFPEEQSLLHTMLFRNGCCKSQSVLAIK